MYVARVQVQVVPPSLAAPPSPCPPLQRSMGCSPKELHEDEDDWPRAKRLVLLRRGARALEQLSAVSP